MIKPEDHNRFEPNQLKGLEDAVAAFHKGDAPLQDKLEAVHQFNERLRSQKYTDHVDKELSKWYFNTIEDIAKDNEGWHEEAEAPTDTHLNKQIKDVSTGVIYSALKKHNRTLLERLGYRAETLDVIEDTETDKKAVLEQARMIDNLIGSRQGEQSYQALLSNLEGEGQGLKVSQLHNILDSLRERGKERFADAARQRSVAYLESIYPDLSDLKADIYKYADNSPFTVVDKKRFKDQSLQQHASAYLSARRGPLGEEAATQFGIEPPAMRLLEKPVDPAYKKAA